MAGGLLENAVEPADGRQVADLPVEPDRWAGAVQVTDELPKLKRDPVALLRVALSPVAALHQADAAKRAGRSSA